MDEFHYKQNHFVKLTYGCLLYEDSVEPHEQCMSHELDEREYLN